MVEGGESLGIAIKGVLIGLGLASGVGLIALIITSFKPLVSMISNIFKLISLILKPISDMFTVLLLPILLIIKPIAAALKQIMLPFLQLGIQIMRMGSEKISEGDLVGGTEFLTLGAMTILEGLGVVILTAASAVIQMLAEIVLQLSLLLLSLFIPGLDAKIPDIMTAFREGSGLFFTSILGMIVNGIDEANKELGIETGSFRDDTINKIAEFLGTDGALAISFVDKVVGFTDDLGTNLKSIVIGDDPLSAKSVFTLMVDEMEAVGKVKIKNMISSVKFQLDQLANDMTAGLVGGNIKACPVNEGGETI